MSGLIDTNQFDMIRKMLDKAQYGLCFPMDAVMKVYALIDKLPEMKGFYAVVHFLTLLYELSLLQIRHVRCPVLRLQNRSALRQPESTESTGLYWKTLSGGNQTRSAC